MLQLRMQESRVSFELVPTQDEFISYLQWLTNKPFYYEWGSSDASESEAAVEKAQDEDDEEEEEGDQGEEDKETISEWLTSDTYMKSLWFL